MKTRESTLTMMTTMRRYELQPGALNVIKRDQIASLQSRDTNSAELTGTKTSQTERSALRLPPVTEDESSVYSLSQGNLQTN